MAEELMRTNLFSGKNLIRRVFVVVPHFNEEQVTVSSIISSLMNLAKMIQNSKLCVIYVDDGSLIPLRIPEFSHRDNSNFSINLVRIENNRGPGFAFKSGFMELPSNLDASDYVVLVEGDNTSNLNQILPMLWIANNPYSDIDVVLASPYSSGGGFVGVKSHRVLISKIANFLVRNRLGLDGVHTLGNFFRIINGSAFKRLQNQYGVEVLQSDGFESMIELLWKMRQLEMNLIEFPTIVNHQMRLGKSKMRIIRTSISYLKLIRNLR